MVHSKMEAPRKIDEVIHNFSQFLNIKKTACPQIYVHKIN